MVYANLHKRPEELEKTSFIALGSLRSYPNQQFRKLQCALLDDVLPWSLSCVETIVRQTFYQISDLTEEEDPEMLWKADMLHGENGLQTFCAVLKLTATKLEQTPRCFENIPLLSELTGYLHQFSADAQPIVKLFARMARRWATNSRLENRVSGFPIELLLSVRRSVFSSFVKKDTDKVLTSLVHLVSATSPEQLEWKEIEELSRSDEQFGCCFESADS
ncbi:hypothetical protein GQ600_15919 [Phytophthora cactorum]|nr:hypothetical protein GQ600_15919 [Phytophthora cactorum]